MKVNDTINLEGQKWHDFLTSLRVEFEKRSNADLALAWAYRAVCPKSDLAVDNFPGIYIIGNEHNQEDKLRERYIGRLIKIRSDTAFFFPGEDLLFKGKSMSAVFCSFAIWHQETLHIHGNGKPNAACYAYELGQDYIFTYTYLPYEESGGKFFLKESMFDKIKNFFKENFNKP
ncbi:MAG: hypothetical protein PHP62_00240 [Candidatus Moranbacteria bacterium]|nr:hypothetical protein [Candidatus Moranbacteria bacterium]